MIEEKIFGHFVFFEGNIVIANAGIFTNTAQRAKVYSYLIGRGCKLLFESDGALYFKKPAKNKSGAE